MAGKTTDKAAAAKSAKSAKSAKHAKARGGTPRRSAILKAAMDEAAVKGWHGLSMTAIAERAGVSLDALRAVCPDRLTILTALNDEIDTAMLAEGPADTSEAITDRLFELLMRRFDALTPYKEGLRALTDARPPAPLSMLCSGLHLHRSMGWVLDAAGIGANGPSGHLRRSGLLAIYALTLRDWLADTSPDHAATMAALDKRLKRADRMLSRCCRRRQGQHDVEIVAEAL